MEDRLAEPAGPAPRPGLALVALVAILVITAAWWALALWPAAAEPEWLTRTRAACFGSARGGLPDAGGWVLLIGEPIGMLAALIAIGGRSLRRDIAWLVASPARRITALATVVLLLGGTGMLGTRVGRAWSGGRNVYAADLATLRSIEMDAPEVPLMDQRGREIALASLPGPAIVTFAFGHCTTVCPVIVNHRRAARRRAGRDDIPLVVVTLDPWRDTPERLPAIARHWELAPHDRVLSGSVQDVEAALDAFGIARRRNETTGDVDHATTVFVIDHNARVRWRGDGGVGGVEGVLRGM